MEAKVGFVGAGEVALFHEVSEVVAGLFDLFDLFRRRTITGQRESGSFQNLSHFADLADLRVAHLFGEEAAFCALEHKAFTEQPSEAFPNGRAIDAKAFGPGLFNDPIVRSDLENEDAVTQ